MTTHNSIIADLSHEIDRIIKISNLLLDVAIRSEQVILNFDYDSPEANALLVDIRYAIDEAHHG